MSRKKRGRIDGDPPNSERPRGKSRSQQKSARDGKTWTPTEERQRDRMLKQFCQLDGPKGNTEAYRNSPAWCTVAGCNRLAHGHEENLEWRKQFRKKLDDAAFESFRR